MANFFFAMVAAAFLAAIIILGSVAAQQQTRHILRPIPMANEIRHKGPVMGQTVYYVTSGTVMPAIVRSVNANGTVNLTTFPGGSVVTDVASVPYDPTLQKNPSWYWSDDL